MNLIRVKPVIHPCLIAAFFMGAITSETIAAERAHPELRLAQASTERQPVGEAPPETEQAPPDVEAVTGGVLTPQGNLIIEPSIQFSNSQVNRFTFLGVEILESFLIGLVEAEDFDRDLISPALTARYGLTDRLELELKVPYVYREDRRTISFAQIQPEGIPSKVDGEGIGDIEVALHYQINQGLGGWPFFIGNLRYKSDTGEGPFDVDRNADGIETELPTGSGFQAIEPSVTVLYPSDPAVFFANVGYLFNIKDDINKTLGQDDNALAIGEVDPGDALRLSFGMAYAINERTSFTLGYKHDFIEETETERIDPRTGGRAVLSAPSLDVGALLVGFGLRVNQRIAVNLNLELGVTADAPDVAMTLRVPFSFDLF